MVQQEARATVRCGWDPKGGKDGSGGRREVTLPDLTTDQKRRAMRVVIYFLLPFFFF